MARTGYGGGGGTIHPILKPEVQRVVSKQKQLLPFQDEKRDVYQKHIDISAEVFQNARDVRAAMAAEYEARNKFVHDKLAEMKKRNDDATLKSLNILKAFAITFEEGLNERKAKWKSEFKAGRDLLKTREAANTAEEEKLDNLIKEEHEACKKHTQEGVGPILDKLQEERDSLAVTIHSRNTAHQDFCEAMEEHFDRLKRTLSDESRERQKECADTHDRARKLYAELDALQRQAIESVKDRLQGVREKLAVEAKDTTNSNAWVTHEMMQFMAHFEASVTGALNKQELSKTHLLSLKEQFNS